MQSRAGIFRTGAELEEAVERIGDLRRRWARVRAPGRRTYNPGWHLVFDLRNLLVVAEAVARCALQRRESRGGHARLDFPGPDLEWGKMNGVVTRDGEAMRVATSPLPEMPAELRALMAKA